MHAQQGGRFLHGAPALVDGREGRNSRELVIALYESMATGREVTLPLGRELSTRLGERA